MTTYALLMAGLLLAGDGLPQNLNRVYPVKDLLVPIPKEVQRVYPVKDLLVPDPQSDNDRYIRNLFPTEYVPYPESDLQTDNDRYIRGLFPMDYIPYPESDLAPPKQPNPVDPVLGYFPPSKRLLGRLPPLGYFPPSKKLLEKVSPKR